MCSPGDSAPRGSSRTRPAVLARSRAGGHFRDRGDAGDRHGRPPPRRLGRHRQGGPRSTAFRGGDRRHRPPLRRRLRVLRRGGVAALDCDGDGRSELFLAGGSGGCALPQRKRTRRCASIRASWRRRSRTGPRSPVPIRSTSMETVTPISPCCASARTSSCGDSATAASSARDESLALDGGDTWTVAFSATWEADNELPTLAFGDHPRTDREGCEDSRLRARRPPMAATRRQRPCHPGTARCRSCSATGTGPGRADLRITERPPLLPRRHRSVAGASLRRRRRGVHRRRKGGRRMQIGNGHRQRRPHRRRLSRGVPAEPGRQQAADAR